MIFTALLGNPVEHSISNYLFAEYARITGIEYAHLKLRVPTEDELPIYMNSLRQIKCSGLNITLPYKLSVIKYLDEQDKRSQAIGAVNTVTMSGNKLVGYNTDGIGAYQAIEKNLRPINNKDQIIVLGSGGAARAIIYEIYQHTDHITILGIDQDKLKKLADDFFDLHKERLKVGLLNDDRLFECLLTTDFIINATSIGMYPKSDESLISNELILQLERERNLQNLFAFDAVFNPHNTKMLKTLKQRGANICSGLWMMIYQAVEAFRLWTGQDISNAPFEDINSQLIEVLKKY
ncbi:shikimate dehydrogenase [Moorena sp. SIO3H5]|uniref:shikimate dehydrogenase n=1 Tax=Moorena sp. SIO3H5 TaxID=2607834 RepID=UPI0013B9C0E6|nr:shikimate dehydrogenase [Moorena sp. SIO3H5]NEO70403.1 shikimate dehydrogenase [Moorena sp. SIO3H5]